MSVQVKGSGTIGGLDEGLVVSGIVTSSTQINVGSNIKLGNAGVVTATSFVGSGANLTGITSPAITSIGSDGAGRVLTSDGDGTATAHSFVTIESSRLSVNRGSGTGAFPLIVRRTDASGIIAEFSNSSGYGVYIGQNGATGEGYIRTATGQDMVFTTNAGSGIANERVRIDTTGSLHIASGGSRTNVSANADDIIIGNTSTSNETGISMFSTSTSGIRFNDASGTDAAIEYSHSARELRFNAAGANRLTFGINASNTPVFNMGVSSSDTNNHNQGDRTSVKVGDYLNIESARGAGHNAKAGLGYNCYFHSNENFYCGTNSPSSGDNRPAAYGMGHGNHYFYSDASNTAHSAQAQLTMTRNMVIHRSGHVTKPNQPSFLVAPANDGQTNNGYGVYTTVFHNTGNHYNTSNGRFTAPVTGYYTFGANYVGAAACENVFVRFYINGSYNQRGQHYSGGGNAWGTGSPYMSCDLSGTHVLLQAGDYVNLHLAASGANGGQSSYMRWYGYLVH